MMHLPADAGTADFVPLFFVPELMPLYYSRFRARSCLRHHVFKKYVRRVILEYVDLLRILSEILIIV
jgi:hypothetical protein